jgi:predicted transcriptional regulator
MTEATRPRDRGGQEGHEPRARIRARELRVLDRSVQGWSQHRIAAEERITQPAVSKILARAEDRILRDLTAVVAQQKARQTLRLEHLYRESMLAWDESKSDATRRVQRKTQTGTGGTGATVAELVVETQHGDPRFLDVGRKVLADMRTLWGLDAPQKLDVRATHNRYEEFTEDGLRAELARQRQLLAASDVPSPTPASVPKEDADGND